MPDEPAPTSAHVRGPEDGPDVLLYGDASCPRCQQAVLRLTAAPVRLTWRHLVLRARGPRPRALAGALEAAGRQGAFWPFLDAVVREPGRTEDPDLWALAGRLELDLDAFQRDRRDERTAAAIAADLSAGLSAGAVGTPAIVVDGSPTEHGIPDDAWIDALLRAA
jgi:protein-disulfide isomerase